MAAKDSMNDGDRIFLPITVKQEVPSEKQKLYCNEEEVNFIRSLVLYKVLKFDSFVYFCFCFPWVSNV